MTSAASTAPDELTVAGVDGAGGAWVVARLRGRDLQLSVSRSVDDVLASTADCVVVGVDMPLSVPEDGYRTGEVALRSFLGSARSSLFFTPVRDAVESETWEQACVVSRARTGKAISKQSWYLTAYIREWGAAALDDRVIEVHPESSFRALATTTEFTSKKRARGIAQRLSALSAVVDPATIVAATAGLDDGPAIDDVLDAVAAAWSARRWAAGTARVFGSGAADSRGHPDRIVV